MPRAYKITRDTVYGNDIFRLQSNEYADACTFTN
jgi:hypothetical protein